MIRIKSFFSGFSIGIAQLCMCVSLFLAIPQSADAHGPYAFRVYHLPLCIGDSVVVYDGYDFLALIWAGFAESFRVNGGPCHDIYPGEGVPV